MEGRRSRRWAAAAGRGLVVLLALAAVGEGLSRAVLTAPSPSRYDERFGFVYRPGASIFSPTEGGARLRLNERGLNDDALRQPPPRGRVLVLGDSFVEAFQVERPQNFVSVAESLCRADLVNLGRSAFSPVHYAEWLERFSDLGGDLLVATVGPEDADEVTAPTVRQVRDGAGRIAGLSAPAGEPRSRLREALAPLLEGSALLTHLARRAGMLAGSVDLVGDLRGSWPGAAPERRPRAEAAPAVLRERLAFVLARLGVRAPVLVLYLPRIEWHPAGAAFLARPAERDAVRAAATEAGAGFLDAGPAMLDQYARTLVPSYGFDNLRVGSGHLNVVGHRVVGELLAGWLAGHGRCPKER